MGGLKQYLVPRAAIVVATVIIASAILQVRIETFPNLVYAVVMFVVIFGLVGGAVQWLLRFEP